MRLDKPWVKYYGDVPETIDYPEITMYQAVMKSAATYPDAVAYSFFGYESTYEQLVREIDQFANALWGLGLRPGDRITISMPTCPQGIICFYAANKLGAVASMIHPLSPPKEIAFYLNRSRSRFALTLDAFYPGFKAIADQTPLEVLILSRIPDYLPLMKKIGFFLTKGRKIASVPEDPMVHWWKDLKGESWPEAATAPMAPDDPAVIMYSGGTTGVPKGIVLSNMNFIAEGMQVAAWGRLDQKSAILAILPIFHGFGLGVCVNAAFMGGAKSILVPQFTPETVARLIRSHRPNFLVGVPTLFDVLSRNPLFQRTDLSCLKATFCGADTLPPAVKRRFEQVVQRAGGNVQLLEGYGLTEAVTAIMAMPLGHYREGSMGIPFPDMLAKIVKPGTTESLGPGQEGELCIHGPAVMLGYLDDPQETANTLISHPDGKVWLHTGDIASMDEDGFFYFKLRQKRMIKSSGMNVYPAQVEAVLYQHEAVQEACVIGVPDPSQVQRVKAFVVLKEPSLAGPELVSELIAHCRQHLIKWSCPREIEFRDQLPKTLIGKIAFKQLEEEEIAKIQSMETRSN